MHSVNQQEDGYHLYQQRHSGNHFCVITTASSSIPYKQNSHSFNFKSCLTCIQLIILLLKIFPTLGMFHPSLSVTVHSSMDTHDSYSMNTLRMIDIPHWIMEMNDSACRMSLYATLAAISRDFARSTTLLPLHAHSPQDVVWQTLRITATNALTPRPVFLQTIERLLPPDRAPDGTNLHTTQKKDFFSFSGRI
ncbi:hypothetical protein PAMP_001895 [Pampus punctatissimus]